MSKRFTCLLLILLGIAGVALAEAPSLRLAPMPIPPIIDGVIGLNEWRGATEFAGLGSTLDARESYAFFGYDQNALYFALRTEMPPDGKLISQIKRRGDQAICSDDSVEIWIAPPKQGRRTDGSPRSFGYFQLITNFLGTLYDVNHDPAPGSGVPLSNWNVKAQVASKVTPDGYWEVEVAVPLSELGMQKLVLPSEWRINLVRNWKNGWHQATIGPEGSFANVAGMASIIFDSGAPAIQVRSLGKLMEVTPNLQIVAQNSTSRTVEIEMAAILKAGETKAFDEKKTVSLTPGQDQSISFASIFTPAASNTLVLTATDKSSGKSLYQRTLLFGPMPEHKWTMAEDYLIFSLSFDDGSLRAEKSKGKAAPADVKGETIFDKGVRGKGLSFKNLTVTYDRKDNLTVPGAVSFWMKPNGDPVNTYLWYTQYKGDGYLGVQHRDGTLQFWLQYFPGIQNGNIISAFPWKKDRWFNILINFSPQKIEMFLDGHTLGQINLDRPLKSEELAPFILCGHGCIMDDIRNFSRTLTTDEIQKFALGEESMEGRITYLPSLKSVAIEAVTGSEASEKSTSCLMVTDGKKDVFQFDVLKKQWVPTTAGTLRLREIVKLPSLPDGTYDVWLQTKPTDGTESRMHFKRSIVVKHYEWLGNSLGKSDVIIPPFTPLEMKGNRVKCVLREHTLGLLGLWQQVESMGKEILARPIALNAESKGKSLTWRNQSSLKRIEVKPNHLRLTSEAENTLMRVQSTCEFDYDGLMKINLNLIPRGKGQTLDRLWLEIPVKAEVATLFHASGEFLRANPAGAVPSGTGVLWQSRSIPQAHLDNFIPYFWVGGEERGICWVADWDKDWVHCSQRSAVELVREGKEVIIRVNFINGPIVLNRPRTLEFALQASPVKPMPKDWRQLVYDFHYPGRGRFPLLMGPSWGAHLNGTTAVYPQDQDFSYVQKLAEYARGKEVDSTFKNQWIKKVMEGFGPSATKDTESFTRVHVDYGFHCVKDLFLRKPPGKILYYTCAAWWSDVPENTTFKDEWQWPPDCYMHSSDSWVDYAVWYANKMMEAGMGGIYVDNLYTYAKFNWPMGEAYFDDKGDIHPSLGIWRLRNHIRRLATMMFEKGRDPFVYGHMTNANMLPVLAFAQANLDWEWKYGSADFQERFTPDFIRAESLGLQAGTLPTVLGGVTGMQPGSDEYLRVCRTQLALAFPHELFIYGNIDAATAIKAMNIISAFRERPGTEAFPYWGKQAILNSEGNLLVTAYRFQNEVLLVIGNLGDAGKYNIILNRAHLKLGPVQKAINAETEKEIPVSSDGVTLETKKHDFALVKIWCQ